MQAVIIFLVFTLLFSLLCLLVVDGIKRIFKKES